MVDPISCLELRKRFLALENDSLRAQIDRWNEAVHHHLHDKLVQIPKGGPYHSVAQAIAIRANLTGAGD